MDFSLNIFGLIWISVCLCNIYIVQSLIFILLLNVPAPVCNDDTAFLFSLLEHVLHFFLYRKLQKQIDEQHMKTPLVKCSDCLRACWLRHVKRENVGLRPLATWQKTGCAFILFLSFFFLSMLVGVQSWEKTSEAPHTKTYIYFVMLNKKGGL